MPAALLHVIVFAPRSTLTSGVQVSDPGSCFTLVIEMSEIREETLKPTEVSMKRSRENVKTVLTARRGTLVYNDDARWPGG